MTANPAPNAVLHAVTDYAPDPHGWSMVHALQTRAAGFLRGGLYIGPRTGEWTGWTAPLQRFRGASGTARPYAEKSSTMADQNTTPSLAATFFADRMGRS